MNIIAGAGIFIYPLGLCSLLAVFIIVERLFSLRTNRVMPKNYVAAFIAGRLPSSDADDCSVVGRMVRFYKENRPDPDALKAYAQLEVTHMERGLYVLDIIISAAPLIGLLGTVAGLVQVFSNMSLETGMPDPGTFVQGIALALTTTLIGLSIAIPAIVGNRYLYRRVDKFTSQISVALERLIDLSKEDEASA